MGGREDEEYPDEVEERLINEEYKIWKKNTPFLYGEPENAPIASCVALLTSATIAQIWSSPTLLNGQA
jgi:hypothetical protein